MDYTDCEVIRYLLDNSLICKKIVQICIKRSNTNLLRLIIDSKTRLITSIEFKTLNIVTEFYYSNFVLKKWYYLRL